MCPLGQPWLSQGELAGPALRAADGARSRLLRGLTALAKATWSCRGQVGPKKYTSEKMQKRSGTGSGGVLPEPSSAETFAIRLGFPAQLPMLAAGHAALSRAFQARPTNCEVLQGSRHVMPQGFLRTTQGGAD